MLIIVLCADYLLYLFLGIYIACVPGSTSFRQAVFEDELNVAMENEAAVGE